MLPIADYMTYTTYGADCTTSVVQSKPASRKASGVITLPTLPYLVSKGRYRYSRGEGGVHTLRERLGKRVLGSVVSTAKHLKPLRHNGFHYTTGYITEVVHPSPLDATPTPERVINYRLTEHPLQSAENCTFGVKLDASHAYTRGPANPHASHAYAYTRGGGHE